jgi:3-phenylpropionate/cinnamic acid dioxygenase small subunit
MTDLDLVKLIQKEEAESFLFHEAELLDARNFEEWLGLLTSDIQIVMPLTRNVPIEDTSSEYSQEGFDANWIDEGLETLKQRVKQLATGSHWAEQPPSRTTRMISNIQVVLATTEEMTVDCRFLLYRNRNEDEQDFFIGKRRDTLRREAGFWKLARRLVRLDQNVLLAKNLSVFF